MNTFYRWSIILIGMLLLVAACTPPTTEPTSFLPTEAPNSTPLAPAEVAVEVAGCAAGGLGVFTPEDVRCYLESFPAEQVREIDEETAVLFTDPNSLAEWVGGAIIYHIPTVSSLVLDRNGDVDPGFSHIEDRTALVAYSRLAANPQLMAELKQQTQELWQTGDSGQPEVRLHLAWQDGDHSVFLVAIAGLPANHDRFYCPEEVWTIGDEEIRVIADCIAREEGTLVRHLFFTAREVSSSQPVPVQLVLDDVPSNTLQVSRGEVALETAVYQAAISHHSQRTALVQQTTTTELFNPDQALGEVINQNVLENFILTNQHELNLSYIFLASDTLFLQPTELIERDYLPPTSGPPDCDRFRLEYPALGGGIVSLSQIGLSGDGQQAVLFLKRECGETAVTSSYLLLENRDDNWVVIGEYGRLPVLAASLEPGLVYNGRSQGCGSIFVYKANDDEALSEFLTMFISAPDFALSEAPLTLEIADYPEQITVKIDLFGGRVYEFGEFPYCNDVGPEAEPQLVWRAQSGTVTISINGALPEENCQGEGFETTILLENVTFSSGNETVTLNEVLFEDVFVGWCSG